MTTIELLNEIEKAPAFMGGNERYKSVAGSDILYQQDIECIRKDLEVLEIIKKGFSKNFLAERLKDAYLRDYLNDEDYEKIENWEWLEK